MNRTKQFRTFTVSCLLILAILTAFSLPVRAVEGATRGSSESEYVEDRKVWEAWPEPKVLEDFVISAEEVHIPRILLESEDAAAANKELDEAEAYLLEEYKMNLSMDSYNPMNTSFSVYQDEQILSVHFEYFDFSINDSEHLILNFRLEDGKRLTDAELAEHLGVGDRLLGLMEETIAAKYKLPPYSIAEPEETVYAAYNMEFFEGFALQDLWETFSPDDSRVFLDEVGNPKLVYRFFGPAGGGSYTTVSDLPLLLRYEDQEISPVFARMAREMGIDPRDENVDALIVFVGAGYDEPSVRDMLIRLFPWQMYYLDYNRPNTLLRAEYSPDLESFVLEGYEYYLLVPKYKHATVSLKALDMTEEGELVPLEFHDLDLRCVRGPVLIGQNVSDLWPNAEVVLTYRGEEVRFTPYISLKDGSLVSHERVLNAETVFDWPELSPEEQEYAPFSSELYNALLMFLGEPLPVYEDYVEYEEDPKYEEEVETEAVGEEVTEEAAETTGE